MLTGSLPTASIRWTGRGEGDMRDDARARRAVYDGQWARVTQVHGTTVVIVDDLPDPSTPADALVTRREDVALAVFTADCAPVSFASADGVIGVAHGGWRGIEAGVIEATVAAMRDLGATQLSAALGPCIHAECYEFGGPDLDGLAARYGAGIRATTAYGTLALDMPALVRAALAACGVPLSLDADVCTACGSEWYSHRARGDPERQATIVTRRSGTR